MPSNSTEYMKAYYNSNKDKIKQQVKTRSQKIYHCEICDKNTKLCSYKAHLKTALHKGNIQNIKDEKKVKFNNDVKIVHI